MIHIDKNIPYKKCRPIGCYKYPWREMLPGDSFFVRLDATRDPFEAKHSLLGNAKVMSRKIAQERGEPVSFVAAIRPTGIRVWRKT